MSRPKGKLTDTEPLELWEYTLIMAQLSGHWHTFYQLLWEIGIRCGEALKIQKKDLNNGCVWVIRSKRVDHPRERIPVTPELFAALEEIARRQKSVRLFPYSTQAAALALKIACQRAGIRSTMHPHLFRHGLGNRAYEMTKDMAMVQRLLGHKDIRSTQRYAKPTLTKVLQTFRDINKPGPLLSTEVNEGVIK